MRTKETGEITVVKSSELKNEDSLKYIKVTLRSISRSNGNI
jgi:hypothetical protein